MLTGKTHLVSRRQFTSLATATTVGLAFSPSTYSKEKATTRTFKLRTILASCMYGYTDIAEILPEVHKTGATAIDIWPKRHGSQREQLDTMGEEQFVALLKEHNVSLGCITRYKLGPFYLQEEMRLAKRLGCSTIVTAIRGQGGLKGSEVKVAVQKFIEEMKPHLAIAEENKVTIAIENHPNNPIETPDSLKWLAEFRPSDHLAIAFSPYYLEQDGEKIGKLIRDLGGSIAMFYAWQHGMGSKKPLPREQQLLQMPGRGTLDFAPLLKALKEIDYQGWTEIFMHPYPRGKPIMPTITDVTEEINRARRYLAVQLEE